MEEKRSRKKTIFRYGVVLIVMVQNEKLVFGQCNVAVVAVTISTTSHSISFNRIAFHTNVINTRLDVIFMVQNTIYILIMISY